MDSNVVKFQSLEVNKTYEVKGYAGPFENGYGSSYNLLVEGPDQAFELYATKKLVEYIKKNKPSKKFTFIVKENKNGMKYPHIEGCENRSWIKLI